ncbi:MAG: hydrogenase formation protein HypD [Verrucomicrobiota bacterium]
MTVAADMEAVHRLAKQIGRPVTLMEVCGTHTMAAFRSGLRAILPKNLSLLSGPGCPVCVTPNGYLDRAIAIAQQPRTMVATFGDMMRVPGTESSLEQARAQGALVRVVYSPLDALREAEKNPKLRVVFLGVGFETTAPATAWSIQEAARQVPNFSVLCAHKTMPRAMAALLAGGDVRVDGFLCPGHVSVVIGSRPYEFIVRDFGIPCVVTGFEPADLVAGIVMLLRQVAERRAAVEIQYTRSVEREGNRKAQSGIDDVFEAADAEWRGLGTIPGSGLAIRKKYSARDAGVLFADLQVPAASEPAGCKCGEVLRGAKTPADCPLFRTRCTPDHPVGACMVSGEGTCAAWFKYS